MSAHAPAAGSRSRPGAKPHGRQDKTAREKNTPPPLVGGGWGERSCTQIFVVRPLPQPPPKRGGEFFCAAQSHPDAYGALPLALLRSPERRRPLAEHQRQDHHRLPGTLRQPQRIKPFQQLLA